MNILISVDETYALPLQVMLKSLFVNNPDIKINLYLLHAQINNQILEELNQFVKQHKAILYTLKIEGDFLADLPTMGNHVTQACWYRCFAQQLLPDTLDRILYLDVDIIINKNLLAFYKMDFEDHFLIAAEDIGIEPEHKEAIGMPSEKIYFNSGVLLLNLKKLRKEFHTDLIFKWIGQYKSAIKFCDQDCLNGLFFDSVKIVEWEAYNCYARFPGNYAMFYTYRIKLNEIHLIHYIGAQKPWHIGYGCKFGTAFWKYAFQTGMMKYIYIYFINTIFFTFVGHAQRITYLALKKVNSQLAGTIKKSIH